MIKIPKVQTELKLIWLLIFLLAAIPNLYSQDTEEDELDALLDELFFNEEELLEDLLTEFGKRDFIYGGISFNSSTYYSGRKLRQDQFNLLPQITYYHHSGVTVAVSGSYFEKLEPKWDFTILSLGFQDSFGKNRNLYYYLGYTRYFFSHEPGIFSNSVDLNFGVRTKNRNLGSKISLAYLFGEDNSFQLVSSTYGAIRIVKRSGYSLKFRPQLNIIIAQQTVLQEVITQDNDQVMFELVTSDIFDLLNTQISLPLYLSTRSFDFQLGYTLNIPSPVGEESNLDTTGLITIAIGYLIDLKK